MTVLNEAQTEQLQEITQQLLRVRQEKSITIEKIAIQTNIRLHLLQALDAGDFEILPEPIYVQGFIRRYGEALGLDGQALANTLIIINDFAQFSQNETENLEELPDIHKRPDIHIPAFVPYALLSVLASVGLIYFLNSRLTAESPAKPQNTVPTPQIKTAPLSIPSATEKPDTAPADQSTASSNVEVNLELQNESWLQVTVDGKTAFMGNLNKGERRTWKAKENLTIRSGNAGAVLISVNQQPVKPFGDDGDVKEVTFTPETNTQ
ncbi:MULTISPECIES: RodZ domain-containing protein [unclassified Nodularia (in: cyanobacteria)]|uniref:RodZ domain-containing protein n=1 Tax=unclassified Nodularia (in: cyanobacteria) TaxID=2656917 RepID=UPI00187FC58C|nr:RodZ domain-containing protein [Nodularia sp. LEGE 06071]MBE9200367.1 helix-turn-helix domain-containing protein [Nodularia sp. LEGE 06071]MCC2695843.1 helix-turn-helix domain-containing protein [Nodularia sp. LEGE 04288]